MLEQRLLKRVDWVLLGSVLTLQLYGIVVVASATEASLGDLASLALVRRQFLALLLGWIGLYVAMSFEYGELRRFAPAIYVACLVVLALTLYLGGRGAGAQRWLQLGPLSLQPAELAKLAVIATLAAQVARHGGKLTSWGGLLLSLIHIAVPMAMIAVQPDLGTALVLAAIWLGVALIGGVPMARLILMVTLVLALVVGALYLHLQTDLALPLQPYQINRLLVFVNPDLDPAGSGYHLRQSIMAIGSGRLTGQGLFAGELKGLRYLPEQHTDFVFAVIGEETGFVGAVLLLVLFGIFLWRALLVIPAARSVYGALLAAGIVSLFGFHIVVNVGMTVGLMPITGLPLPFISYGGTALVANSIAVGLLVNVGMKPHHIMF